MCWQYLNSFMIHPKEVELATEWSVEFFRGHVISILHGYCWCYSFCFKFFEIGMIWFAIAQHIFSNKKSTHEYKSTFNLIQLVQQSTYHQRLKEGLIRHQHFDRKYLRCNTKHLFHCLLESSVLQVLSPSNSHLREGAVSWKIVKKEQKIGN